MHPAVNRLLIALSVIGTAVIVLWLIPSASPPLAEHSPAQIPLLHQPAIHQQASMIVTLQIAREAEMLNSPDHNAADDLATVSFLISQYRRHHEENPVGPNEEISTILLGHNPQGIAYLPAHGAFLDEQGRLIDRWGTPYFFHALAHDRMEIRSAGPDHEMWSADDVVHHPD